MEEHRLVTKRDGTEQIRLAWYSTGKAKTSIAKQRKCTTRRRECTTLTCEASALIGQEKHR